MELLPQLREQPGREGEAGGCAREGGTMSVVVVVVALYDRYPLYDSLEAPFRRYVLVLYKFA